jgi:pimeloyl-ACP methyl ester carboxylesterase
MRFNATTRLERRSVKIPVLATLVAAAAPTAAQIPTPASLEAGVQSGTVTTPRFGHVRLRTGVRLRYAEQGNAAGEPVILLHGLTDSWYSYSRVMPFLPAALRAIAIDQRGHGDSDRPASGYTVTDFAEDVIAFLDTMGIRRATIIGHSMGAFVAQRVAIIAPDRVERLVLIDGAPSARSAALLELKQELAAQPARMRDEFLRAFQYGTVHAPVPEPFMARVITESAKVPTRVARSALDGLLASGDSAQLGAIRAPTLLVWGEHDPIFDRASQAAYERGIAASALRLYPDASHAPHWEAPERFVQDLLAFIARTPTT